MVVAFRLSQWVWHVSIVMKMVLKDIRMVGASPHHTLHFFVDRGLLTRGSALVGMSARFILCYHWVNLALAILRILCYNRRERM